LRLRRGKKWAPVAGPLTAQGVTVDGKNYPLANGDGVRVAVVLADPSIEAGTERFHETQSKVISIYGSGFTNAADTHVELQPTRSDNYKVLAVTKDTIRLQLKEGFDWLPSHLSLVDSPEDSKVALEVLSIDTGAGKIQWDTTPITVGIIYKDREGVVCDDSCEFAFDGVCDDGTEDESYYYYEDGDRSDYAYSSYYEDDDMGGYYNDEERDGGFYYAEGNMIDDDYYQENDEYTVSACVEGTDCTDCGGVDAIVDWSEALADPDNKINVCSNTCVYARDGVCDDPRGVNYCKIGTDCQDCGPVGKDNFTKNEDDGWWDDDDDYWSFNDVDFVSQNQGPASNPHLVKKFRKPLDNGSSSAMFLTVLEGMVYTVGCIFGSIGLYILYRYYHGYSLPFMHVFSPDAMQEMSTKEFSMASNQKMAITPDVIRT